MRVTGQGSKGHGIRELGTRELGNPESSIVDRFSRHYPLATIHWSYKPTGLVKREPDQVSLANPLKFGRMELRFERWLIFLEDWPIISK
jgi:hypothetical protein